MSSKSNASPLPGTPIPTSNHDVPNVCKAFTLGRIPVSPLVNVIECRWWWRNRSRIRDSKHLRHGLLERTADAAGWHGSEVGGRAEDYFTINLDERQNTSGLKVFIMFPVDSRRKCEIPAIVDDKLDDLELAPAVPTSES